jgi:hypothetical protein
MLDCGNTNTDDPKINDNECMSYFGEKDNRACDKPQEYGVLIMVQISSLKSERAHDILGWLGIFSAPFCSGLK